MQTWTGMSFKRARLRDFGVVIPLCHTGEMCPSPLAQLDSLVFHTNGIHNVVIEYCGCSHTAGTQHRFVQLLRYRLFPATLDRPKTAFTFDVLDTFHKLTLQGKTTMYDYHETLIQLTDNTGDVEGLVRAVSCSDDLANPNSLCSRDMLT